MPKILSVRSSFRCTKTSLDMYPFAIVRQCFFFTLFNPASGSKNALVGAWKVRQLHFVESED